MSAQSDDYDAGREKVTEAAIRSLRDAAAALQCAVAYFGALDDAERVSRCRDMQRNCVAMANRQETDLKWVTPGVLRQRPDADRIECQKVLSGRWTPLADRYWDNCAIPVHWRLAEPHNQHGGAS